MTWATHAHWLFVERRGFAEISIDGLNGGSQAFHASVHAFAGGLYGPGRFGTDPGYFPGAALKAGRHLVGQRVDSWLQDIKVPFPAG